jgi:superoxide reductase
MELKFYKCEVCGNIVAFIENKGVPLVCCGKKMTEMVPGAVDGAVEKHLPVVEIKGNKVTVSVGEVEHPMTEEHNIGWVVLQTKEGNQRKALQVCSKPAVEFMICDSDEVVSAFAYCNLHGLWQTKVEKPVNKYAKKEHIICKCKNVSYADVEDALHKSSNIGDAVKAFDDVQEITKCSTGCGGCHDKILEAMSEIMEK